MQVIETQTRRAVDCVEPLIIRCSQQCYSSLGIILLKGFDLPLFFDLICSNCGNLIDFSVVPSTIIEPSTDSKRVTSIGGLVSGKKFVVEGKYSKVQLTHVIVDIVCHIVEV